MVNTSLAKLRFLVGFCIRINPRAGYVKIRHEPKPQVGGTGAMLTRRRVHDRVCLEVADRVVCGFRGSQAREALPSGRSSNFERRHSSADMLAEHPSLCLQRYLRPAFQRPSSSRQVFAGKASLWWFGIHQSFRNAGRRRLQGDVINHRNMRSIFQPLPNPRFLRSEPLQNSQ